jgi:CTP:molybdopterin cytidylyltransferase MocA
MFSTIQTGMAFAMGDEALVILPADMPFVKPETVVSVIAECRRTNAPVAASFNGRHGHPLALPARLRDALLEANPAGNLKELLKGLNETPASLEVDDEGVVRDVDTPKDLEH